MTAKSLCRSLVTCRRALRRPGFPRPRLRVAWSALEGQRAQRLRPWRRGRAPPRLARHRAPCSPCPMQRRPRATPRAPAAHPPPPRCCMQLGPSRSRLCRWSQTLRRCASDQRGAAAAMLRCRAAMPTRRW
eukprot:scaffold7695_cov64-Phaeocystis_antarctica.AAC.10